MGIKLIVVGSILNIQFKDYLDFEGDIDFFLIFSCMSNGINEFLLLDPKIISFFG